MSDFENDIDDELLELAGAGATEKKRKRRQGSSSKPSSKRRKADVSMDSDFELPEVESEEEGDSDLYPLDGRYVNESDRQRLMQMSEIEREEIISQRLEEKQRLEDKRMISQMVKDLRNADDETIAKTARRPHAVRGATKEKTRKLDELKAKRKAKDEKKRTNSPKRDRSSSPMDMEISDDESEDGQITRLEQEEEKERKLFNKPVVDEDQPVGIEDLEKIRLTRDMLAKYCMAPWFEDYVKGAWVRYLIGSEGGQPVYRICEISNLSADLVKPYKVNDKTVNQAFDLKHGKSIRSFLMDKVSNADFHPKEFDRLVRACAAEEVKLPSKRHLEKKITQSNKLLTQPMTENDINAMLARKNQLQSNRPSGATALEKSRLNQARTLAQRRHDYAEVAEIDIKLAELAASTIDAPLREERVDMLAKVNERNRKANLEAVRKAELIEAERKRKERKLAASGGTLTPQDPSARLKILPRLFNAATPSSRPGTPSVIGTPQPGSRPVTPLPPSALSGQTNGTKTFEATVIESIEVDLGDF